MSEPTIGDLLARIFELLCKLNPEMVEPLLTRTAEQLHTRALDIWQTLRLPPTPPYTLEALTESEQNDCLRTWGTALVCISNRIQGEMDTLNTYYTYSTLSTKEATGTQLNQDAQHTNTCNAWHTISTFLTTLFHENELTRQVHDIARRCMAPAIIQGNTAPQHIVAFALYTEQEQEACLFIWATCLVRLYVQTYTLHNQLSKLTLSTTIS